MNMIGNPGRFIGLLYAVASVFGIFGLIYVPGKLIVHGDAMATVANIVASETLFRLGIAADLIGQGLFIFVALALYDLLKGVDSRNAVIMLILILTAIPIAFLNEVNALAAIHLTHGEDFFMALEKPQRDALAMLFLNLRGDGFDIAGIFWGLWLFPLGLLVYRSKFLPRALGVWLVAGCFGWLARSGTSLVLPQYEHAVFRWTTVPTVGELVFMLWLLIMGAKPIPTMRSVEPVV
jgi:hypothetical protein